jgi:hypothetical protein
MRWLAGFAAGLCAAIALLAGFYGKKSFDDWQANRAELIARVRLLREEELRRLASESRRADRPGRDARKQSRCS